jgi:hypothetical protein
MTIPPTASSALGLMPRRAQAIARIVWPAIFLLTLALVLAAAPVAYQAYRSVCAGEPCPAGQLTPAQARSMAQVGLSPDGPAAYEAGLDLVFSLVFALVALVIFWSRSDDRMALFVSLMLLTFGGATFPNNNTILQAAAPAWHPLIALINAIGTVSLALFFYTFPDGRFRPRWSRWLFVAWCLWQVPAVFFPQSLFNSVNWQAGVGQAAWIVFPASFMLAQLYRYRRASNPLQRQQTKWVVFGMTLGMAGFLAYLTVGLLVPSLRNSLAGLAAATVLYLALLLIPLSIAIAILRSHLWDIDVIIRRTLVYSLLTGLLALVYFGSVVLLQALFTALTPLSGAQAAGAARSDLVTVLSTLAIAALSVPARNRLQAAIDRRFYRRKYDSARTLANFGAALRDDPTADLAHLTDQLLAVVAETMQPESVDLWLKRQG